MLNDPAHREVPIVEGRPIHAVSEASADVIATGACRTWLALSSSSRFEMACGCAAWLTTLPRSR
eukprot:8154697-Pyramimonas_sp.AAC.1